MKVSSDFFQSKELASNDSILQTEKIEENENNILL